MNKEFIEQARTMLRKMCDEEWKRTSSEESRVQYLKDHRDRFVETLSICRQLVPDNQATVLDVGKSNLTSLLAAEYKHLWTIGLDPTVDTGGHREMPEEAVGIPHIKFDLNDAKFIDQWPSVKKEFSLIVFGETIEHLTIAPEYTILCLSSLLADGGILLITTPNAVTLSKRLKFAVGRNPFEQIRLLGENPGHFREYTLDELCEIGERCNLEVVYRRRVNFYNNKKIRKVILKNLLPSFRDSLVVAFKK